MTGYDTYFLSSNTVDLGTAGELEGGFSKMAYGGQNLLMVPATKASFSISKVDLTDIASVTLNTAATAKLTDGFVFELRLDSPEGQVVGSKEYIQGPRTGPEGAPAFEAFTIPLTGTADGKVHTLYVTTKTIKGGEAGTFILAGLIFNAK